MKPQLRLIPHNLSLLGQALLLCCLTFALYVVPVGNDDYVAWPIIGLFYVYFLRSFLSPARIRSDIPVYTTIETLFLIFYYLLFIHPYEAHFLGTTDLRNNTFLAFTYEAGSNQALVAAAVGFVAFHLGLSWARGRNLPSVPAPNSRTDSTYYAGLSYIILILIGGFVALYELAGFQSADEGRYTRITNGGPIADGIYLIISMLCIIAIARAIATLSQRKDIEIPIILSLCVVAYWSARILINGDRNTFFLLAIAAGGGLFTYVRRTSWIALIGCVLVSLAVYHTVEAVRMSRDRSFSGLIDKMFEGRSNAEASSSSSFTITTATLRATFDIVPARQDFGYGRYKVIGFAGIVPLVRGSILGSNTQFTTTAEVLSYHMLGQAAGWSVGSNLISDIYMDFGIIGIPVIMALAGAFAGVVQNHATRNPFSTKAITFYLLVLANFGELARYALDFPVRMLVWSYILFWLYEISMRVMNRGTPSHQRKLQLRKRLT